VLAVPLSNGLLSTIGIRLGQQAYRVRNKNQGAEQATSQNTLPRFHCHPPFAVFVEYISGPDPPTKYVRRQDNLTVPSSQLLFSADRRCQQFAG
jgi:hypothetical protein